MEPAPIFWGVCFETNPFEQRTVLTNGPIVSWATKAVARFPGPLNPVASSVLSALCENTQGVGQNSNHQDMDHRV